MFLFFLLLANSTLSLLFLSSSSFSVPLFFSPSFSSFSPLLACYVQFLLFPSSSFFPLSSFPLSLYSSQHLDMEEDSKSLKGQLLSVCPSLERLPSLDDLLAVWQGVRGRMFMHYQLAARAYFTFLKLSGSQAGSSPGKNAVSFLGFHTTPPFYLSLEYRISSTIHHGYCFFTVPFVQLATVLSRASAHGRSQLKRQKINYLPTRAHPGCKVSCQGVPNRLASVLHPCFVEAGPTGEKALRVVGTA